MLNDSQIDTLAKNLIGQINLEHWLAAFQWDKKALQPAWAIRKALAQEGVHDSALHYADRVHQWGFGAPVRSSVRQDPAFSSGLQTLCMAWSAHPQPWTCQEAMGSLTALMDIKYLGIARVSKFLCFLDQDRYAIYDSRVSYALKDLTLDNVTRVFPFVGGRSVKNAQYVLPDWATGNPNRMAVIYTEFLRLLQRVTERLNAAGGITAVPLQGIVGAQWTPALLEMALFMAGQDRFKGPGILPFSSRR